jgi:hypothetical protein
MKGKTVRKLLFAVLATTGLTTLTAFGQGAVIIDNTSAPGHLDIGQNGNHYSGPFGLELWYLNGDVADNAINSLNGVAGQAANAYALLVADGFGLATHKANADTAVGGIFSGVGEVDIKAVSDVPPGIYGPGLDRTAAGGNVILTLVFWAGTGDSFLSAAYGGMVSFVNPTSDWTIRPPNTPVPPALDNFAGNGAPYTDLVMTTIPEPNVFALAGLGAVLLLVSRRFASQNAR